MVTALKRLSKAKSKQLPTNVDNTLKVAYFFGTVTRLQQKRFHSKNKNVITLTDPSVSSR